MFRVRKCIFATNNFEQTVSDSVSINCECWDIENENCE
jgi:hypothetical protein